MSPTGFLPAACRLRPWSSAIRLSASGLPLVLTPDLRRQASSAVLRPMAFGLKPPGEFLRDFWFLRQQEGVEKRLLMVKLYHHSSQLAVLSSRSNGGSGVTGQRRASAGAAIPQHSTILSFHHSRQCRVGRGQSCKTKPNLGRMGHLGAAHQGSRLCKTKPISGAGRGDERRIVQNEPNLPGGAGRDGAWGTRGVVQTNPIPAILPIRRSALPGAQIVQNEANCPKRGTEAVSRLRIADFGLRIGDRPAAGGREADHAKQTQFRRSADGPEGEMCKTNPIQTRVLSLKFQV